MNPLSFLNPHTIYQTNSIVNGEIKVIEQFGKRELIIGGLQQSGELVAKLWEAGIRKSQSPKLKVQNILLLGLGGGSVIPILNKYFPHAQITAVEIDEMIIEIAKKYFAIQQFNNLTIIHDDAFEYLKLQNRHSESRPGGTKNLYGSLLAQASFASAQDDKRYFDLVLVDTYQGSVIPSKIKSFEFLNSLKRILAPQGKVIFNHIKDGREKEVEEFDKKLRSVFSNILTTDILVNRLFICKNP